MPSADKKIDEGKWFRPDEQFNKPYPLFIQTFARRHLAAAWESCLGGRLSRSGSKFYFQHTRHTRYLSFSQKG